MKLRAAASAATLLVGLALLGAGVAHTVGVTGAALRRGGLFDARHAELLVVGWTLVAPGFCYLVFARAIWRGSTWGYGAALAVGGFVFVEFLLLGSTLGTPDQAIPAYAATLVVLALLAAAWRAELRPPII